ncbi:MAG: hypothetical protein EXS17_04245 [Phycisphaerales bacterium]|nr:hypothetical protein [Phycisphaerales bacterium]
MTTARPSTAFLATLAPHVRMLRCAVLATLLLGLTHAGCSTDSDSSYTSGGLYSMKYRTVALPIFKNSSQDRAVPLQLANALVKEVESSTPYKVTSEGRADTVLRGTITRVDLQNLSQSLATGLTEEMAFKVTVDFEWIDMRTGKPIVARTGFQSSAVFVASLPNNQPIDLGRFAVTGQMARDIVASLQGEW